MLAKFQSDQRLITMLSINCLNSNFCNLKLCIKNEFMDRMVNYIQLVWELACMLRKYRTYNLMVGFSKYEFYNKLLDGVTLVRVTSVITWTQSYIYIYIYIWLKYKTHYLNFTRMYFKPLILLLFNTIL